MAQHRVAVITPYYNESAEILAQCHRSVASQGVAADHFLVADGHPQGEIEGWDVRHVSLPTAHGDAGNTPRGLGGLLARSEGYEFVAYLDADNWYHEGHLRSLLELWEATRGPVCCSSRTFHDLAGEVLPVRELDEDAIGHVDTSCFLIHRSGFDALGIWLDMPKILAPLCDRIFLAGLLHRKYAIASTRQRTVAFRSKYRAHYVAANRPVSAEMKDTDDFTPALAFLRTDEGVTQCVRDLGFWPPSYISM
jgi:glycosyltransferase involved in cell wall biosynthesis